MTVSPEKIAEMLAACEDYLDNWRADFDDNPHAEPVGEFNLHIVKALALELTTLRSQLSGLTDETSSGDHHRFGSPPEPVVNPNAAWCDAYAAWYYQEPS